MASDNEDHRFKIELHKIDAKTSLLRTLIRWSAAVILCYILVSRLEGVIELVLQKPWWVQLLAVLTPVLEWLPKRNGGIRNWGDRQFNPEHLL